MGETIPNLGPIEAGVLFTNNYNTLGWIIIYFIIAIILLIFFIIKLKRFIKNRYRREALKEIKQLDHKNGLEKFSNSESILKDVAKISYPSKQIAPLLGVSFINFLNQQVKGYPLSEKTYFLFKENQYKKNKKFFEEPQQKESLKALVEYGQTWIRRHHV